jgi:two-component system, LuxR family, sensor kinase FixL
LINKFTLPILVSTTYYLTARFGLALSFQPDNVSVFWPPNSIVLTAFLFTERRYWWTYFIAIAPAYFLASFQVGFVELRAIIFFMANCLEIVIPAYILRLFFPSSIQFKKIKDVSIFILIVVFFSPLISASVASLSSFVETLTWWEIWSVWFLGDSLGYLILLPFLLTLANEVQNKLQIFQFKSIAQFLGLEIFLIAVCCFAFGGEIGSAGNIPVLVYLPLPIILWISIKYGPLGASSSTFIVSLISIWNATRAKGPFTTLDSAENVLSLQFFLMVLLISVLLLTALIQEYLENIRALKLSETSIKKHKENLENLVESRTQELEKSKERFKYALEISSDGIWDWDMKTNEVDFSPGWMESLGYSSEEVENNITFWRRIVHSDDLEQVTQKLQKHLDGEIAFYTCENRLLTKGGQWRWSLTQGKVVQWDDEGKPLRMIGTDANINNRKIAEFKLQDTQKQLIHMEKLSALGNLTGSIAHEFNNPIYAIQLILEQLNDEVSISGPPHKGIQIAIKECQRISSFISKLKDFYIPSSGELQSTSYDVLIDETLLLLGVALNKNDIRLIKNMSKPSQKILVVGDQIKQVLLNILNNSIDSIPLDSKNKEIEVSTGNTKNEAWISIKDTGIGISDDIIGSISEPYVTDKIFEKGSGLGLSISYRIIDEHEGRIEVSSQLGTGSTFKIILPMEKAL